MRVDKQVECGCHVGCTMLTHDCEVPCQWPDCLTDEELDALVLEVIANNFL